ncbi:hypothetical protein P4O66_006413, partial [Electrophorus voltai]
PRLIQTRRTTMTFQPLGGGPPRKEEAVGVGDQPLRRLQDRPEMATAGDGAAPRCTAQAAGAPAETPTAGRTSLVEPGLLNTAWFHWRDPEDGTRFTERVPFIREVLFGFFGLHPWALICAQCNGAQRYYDVTMASDVTYRKVLELEGKMSGHPLARHYILEPLLEGDRRMVTIHFFNPHVLAARLFLASYGEVLPGERMVRDELRIWNGRRQYFMKFRKDSEGKEVYPPAYFTWAGNRGGRECGPSCWGLREGGTVIGRGCNAPGARRGGLFPPAALMTSSPARARIPAPVQSPQPSEAPPAPSSGKAKRKRERAQREKEKRMKAGPPIQATPVEEPSQVSDSSLAPKSENFSRLVEDVTPPPPTTYGGREGSPNETPFLEETMDNMERGAPTFS